MSLSDLPEISAADEGIPIILPVHFISLNVRCQGSNELITWQTSLNQNSSHFTIERSSNGNTWTSIGVKRAAGNSATENGFTFIDNNPVQNSYYRIKQYDSDGKVRYSDIVRSSCSLVEAFASWPSPFRDRLSININTDKPSQALIKITDSRETVVKLQKANIVRGNNQITIDVNFLPAGLYQVFASWGNGQTQKSLQVLKL